MEYTLRLTDEDLSHISMALQDVPFRVAAPLIQKINAQLTAAREAAAADDPPATGA